MITIDNVLLDLSFSYIIYGIQIGYNVLFDE